MTKSLDVEARLSYARAAVAVLRTLRIVDKTLRYGEFAHAIGLIQAGGKWEPWHRQQTRDILNLAAAVERQHGEPNDPLQFERIVNQDGEPGAGFHKTTRLVTA